MNSYLLLGSNMHDPQQQVQLAVRELKMLPGVQLLAHSSLKRTAPYGEVDQADFYNQLLYIGHTMTPQALLEAILGIEDKMGRRRIQKWGPRIIDIDILLIQDMIIETKELQVPHYDLHNRAFALELMCEIAPEAWHPILHKTMRELRRGLSSCGGDQ